MTTSTTEHETCVSKMFVSADALVRGWNAVAVTASKDPTRPVLTKVCVELHEGGVMLVTSDSYMLGRVWIGEGDGPAQEVEPRESYLFDIDSLDPFKKMNSGFGLAELTFTLTGMAIHFLSVTVDLHVYPDEFPRWRGLYTTMREKSVRARKEIIKAGGDVPELSVQFNPEFLARFHKITKAIGATKNHPCHIQLGNLGDYAATWEATFGALTVQGLIMPVR